MALRDGQRKQVAHLSLERENARLRRFAEHIAKQPLSEQCRADHENEGHDGEPDFEGAYDAIIEQARAALAGSGEK